MFFDEEYYFLSKKLLGWEQVSIKKKSINYLPHLNKKKRKKIQEEVDNVY
jgi:hypothetical protein